MNPRHTTGCHPSTGCRGAKVADHENHLPKEAVRAFASLGADGSHMGNEERDMHRWLNALWGFDLQPYQLEVNLQVPDA